MVQLVGIFLWECFTDLSTILPLVEERKGLQVQRRVQLSQMRLNRYHQSRRRMQTLGEKSYKDTPRTTMVQLELPLEENHSNIQEAMSKA